MKALDVKTLTDALTQFQLAQDRVLSDCRNGLYRAMAELRNAVQPLVIGDEPAEVHTYEVELLTDDTCDVLASTQLHASDTLAALNAAEAWAKRQDPGDVPPPFRAVCWITGDDGTDVRFLVTFKGEQS